MKRKLSIVIATMAVSATAWAGGLLHNTNQHIAFLRMMARGASHEIDAVYTNPAGLAWLDNEGWTISLNIQIFSLDGHFPLMTKCTPLRVWPCSA